MKYASTAVRRGMETAVVVLPLHEVPGFDPSRPHPGTHCAPDEVEVGWVRDGQSPTGWAPPPPPTPEEAMAAHRDAVEARLDAFARTRDYRDMAAACSYAASAVQPWAAEAAHCAALRDATWQAFHAVVAAVRSGAAAVPGAEALAALLPPLEWPSADT